MKFSIEVPDRLALDTAKMLLRFAEKMAAKLARKQGERGTSWRDCPPYVLHDGLWEHALKGDPVDVANFCAMLSERGESVKPEVTVSIGGIPVR